MNQAFGKQLRDARETRGISVEEAAHGTRMRAAMIEALEAGNLGAFGNPAYAKSFLLLYGKYLGINMKTIAAEIDTGLHVPVDEYQYLSRANETTDGPARRGDFARAHSLPSWAPVIAFGAITAVVVFGVLLWTNMSRLGDVATAPPPKTGDESAAIEPVAADAQPLKVDAMSIARKHESEPSTDRSPVNSVAESKREPLALGTPAAIDQAPVPGVASAGQAPQPVFPDGPSPSVVRPARTLAGTEAHPPAITQPQTSIQAVTQIDGVEVRSAKVISPAARVASNDAALLSQVDHSSASAPQTAPPLVGLTPLDGTEVPDDSADESPLAADPNAVEIEPLKKTWVVIRTTAGGSPIFEDYLYPSARAMRLPAGKYFIEARETDAIEIRRSGKAVAYTAGGVRVE